MPQPSASLFDDNASSGSDLVEFLATAGPGDRCLILRMDPAHLSPPSKALLEIAQGLIAEGRSTSIPVMIEASKGRLSIEILPCGPSVVTLNE